MILETDSLFDILAIKGDHELVSNCNALVMRDVELKMERDDSACPKGS